MYLILNTGNTCLRGQNIIFIGILKKLILLWCYGILKTRFFLKMNLKLSFSRETTKELKN